ncbi:MAG TPA: hypothetical protein P5077_11220 [bacterium]|nr:hypothetical protein [bacterium]
MPMHGVPPRSLNLPLVLAALAALAFAGWLAWRWYHGVTPDKAVYEMMPTGKGAEEAAPKEPSPEVPEAPVKVEIKSLAPAPTTNKDLYTEEEIERLREKRETPSKKKNAYTNADLQKYRTRPGTPDAQKVKKEIEWAEDPKDDATRRQNPSH